MKLKDNIGIIAIIILAIIGIFLSVVITKAIVNANIPEWLKFWLLT